jgi:ATP-dependent protease HslVU (ClpYQ) peptidase subunit
MTTVAASLIHREIAADSYCSSDTGHYLVEKLRVFDNLARGVAGDWDKCVKFHELLNKENLDGDDLDTEIDVECIELRHDGIYVYEGILYPVKIKNQYYAIGSGAEYAIAAMRMGANPRQAVRVASEFDPGTGGPIDVWKLPDEIIKPKRIRRRKA